MEDRFQFRVWKGKENRMVYDVTYLNPLLLDPNIDPENKHNILMQCTGLKDKNGKLIYEGDIVKMNNYILQIVYNKDYACFCAENKNLIGYFRELRNINAFKVIGNIYENPDLI